MKTPTNEQRLIALATAAKDIEGAEGWGMVLVRIKGITSHHQHYADILPEEETRERLDVMQIYGPLLPHNPLDPMNPAECLKRVGVEVNVLGNLMLKDGDLIIKKWPPVPTYPDQMQALLALWERAQSDGGEWMKVWGRAMNPEANPNP